MKYQIRRYMAIFSATKLLPSFSASSFLPIIHILLILKDLSQEGLWDLQLRWPTRKKLSGSYRDLLPVFEVVFDLLPGRVSFRIILSVSNSFCNNLMTILLGSLLDTLVLSILIGLKNHLGFSITQVRPFVKSEVEIGVFTFITWPNSCPLLSVLRLFNNLVL